MRCLTLNSFLHYVIFIFRHAFLVFHANTTNLHNKACMEVQDIAQFANFSMFKGIVTRPVGVGYVVTSKDSKQIFNHIHLYHSNYGYKLNLSYETNILSNQLVSQNQETIFSDAISIRKILILQKSWLPCTTPVLRKLREAFKDYYKSFSVLYKTCTKYTTCKMCAGKGKTFSPQYLGILIH